MVVAHGEVGWALSVSHCHFCYQTRSCRQVTYLASLQFFCKMRADSMVTNITVSFQCYNSSGKVEMVDENSSKYYKNIICE